MPDHRQLVVEVPPSNRDRGRADTAALQAEYPASPIHNGELTDDNIRDQFEMLVIDGVVNDGGHTFGEFNRDYVEAPNLSEVETDSQGRPLSSPYAPSLASPPGGVQDWANQPATPEQTEEAGRASVGPYPGDSLASPHETSINVARQTIGSLRKGTSTPSS